MLFGNENPPAAQVPANQESDIIFDASAADFEDRVLKTSMEKPVIAYFTAPWCGPCKQLGPLMDKVVQEAGGEVLMAKVNLDENQELAAALRIQSVPTVFAFFQGRPLDAFQGALPESQIKEFIGKVVQTVRQAAPDAIDIPEALKMAAQALADKDLGTAQAIYAQVLSQDENNAQAYTGLVRTFIAAGEIEQARQLVDNAPENIAKDSNFEQAKTALELAEIKPDGALEELQSSVEKNPDDHQARYDLAMAEFAAGQQEKSIESLLEIIRRNREWNEEEARKQLLKFFEALGPADPLTVEGRKKLSSILFS